MEYYYCLITEAKVALLDACRQTQEMVQDGEKVMGRLSKDDKVQCREQFDRKCFRICNTFRMSLEMTPKYSPIL